MGVGGEKMKSTMEVRGERQLREGRERERDREHCAKCNFKGMRSLHIS